MNHVAPLALGIRLLVGRHRGVDEANGKLLVDHLLDAERGTRGFVNNVNILEFTVGRLPAIFHNGMHDRGAARIQLYVLRCFVLGGKIGGREVDENAQHAPYDQNDADS